MPEAFQILPCGETALLLEVTDATGVAALVRAVAEWDLVDVVPGARTLGVQFDSPAALTAALPRLENLARTLQVTPFVAEPSEVIGVAVHYDGEDLAAVAALTGLGIEGVIAAHTATPWRVAFGGFAPGFAYLDQGDPRLTVPRLSTPRERVPAGAVGLAGEFSGIYPRASPGGWQLIGRTDAVLWDLGRTSPALLNPGSWVRFEAV